MSANLPLRAVLFDLDGTLVDTAPDFIAVLHQVLVEEHHPAPTNDAIRAAVSHGSAGLLRLAFNMDDNHPDFSRLRQRLLALYQIHLADLSRPFPGIEPLLNQLKRHQLAWGVATNKPLQYAQPLLDKLALFPDCLICPDHVATTKPDPESLLLAATQLHCHPQQIIYVGDHERDIECGQRAGCKTIAAHYGYIDNNQDPYDWDATYHALSTDELWPLISQHLS